MLREETVIDRFLSFCERDLSSGCLIWKGKIFEPRGYGRTFRQITGDRWAHRVSFLLFRGIIPKGKRVLHSCDTPACVEPSHLFLGTQKDNIADCVSKGRNGYRSFHGEDHWKARISKSQAEEIKSSTLSRKQLAKKFGVTQLYIKHVRSSRAWKKTEGLTNVHGRRR